MLRTYGSPSVSTPSHLVLVRPRLALLVPPQHPVLLLGRVLLGSIPRGLPLGGPVRGCLPGSPRARGGAVWRLPVDVRAPRVVMVLVMVRAGVPHEARHEGAPRLPLLDGAPNLALGVGKLDDQGTGGSLHHVLLVQLLNGPYLWD